ncbi:MAG: PhnD/SsuA/transferrin family substrate-binding protein [Gammaproteobacteria bacterium]|nr:PhnD/SsuA/transferrin family substrate-binding protein [Gammaproteobacteria bacterium]
MKIGVLSHRGDTATAINWGATADHLSGQLPDFQFTIVPLDFDEVETNIQNAEIHFLLVNPSIYVVMEVRHRISRIATLSRVINDSYLNQFAGVLFTTRSRQDIKTLKDMKGKHLSAVDPGSLGGFQMIIRELTEHGIDRESDLHISFAGIHDDVVKTVLNGKADAGTVRTGILESMAQSGQIDLDNIRIINQHSAGHFDQLHSTRLYPEWPFSKLPHTSDELAQSVAIALMEMPNYVVKDGQRLNRNRWTIPLEYQPVHEILQSLRLPPYDLVAQFTVTDALKKYWYVILSTAIFFILLAVITTLVIRLNSALKISKQRLERQHSLILDSVADGIYGVDMNGNSTFVNKAMETITGWSAKNLIGKNQHAILHHTRANGEQHQVEDCPVYKTFMDKQTRFIEDDIFWRSDGSSFPVEYSSTPLKDENNATIGSVVIFRDISERKKAERQARKFRHDLAHMARVSTMGEMASGMAHELNQPLTAISTNADACIRLTELSNLDKDTLSDTLEVISLQAKRAGAIIKQLRNFIRKDMPQKNLVNLNEIVREVLVLISQSLNENSINLQLQLDDTIPDVQAQHIQIDQVILNLVKNAIEAMQEHKTSHKTLLIKTELIDNKKAKVTIADSGKGIDETIIQRLFTPFSTSKKNGMGLGLSISEGIINEHGGKLKLKSSSGQGSVFQFTLPLQQDF